MSKSEQFNLESASKSSNLTSLTGNPINKMKCQPVELVNRPQTYSSKACQKDVRSSSLKFKKFSTLGEVYTLRLRWQSQMIIIHDLVNKEGKSRKEHYIHHQVKCSHLVPEPAGRQRMNLVAGSKKISLKACQRHLLCAYQEPKRATQDQHPDPNSME